MCMPRTTTSPCSPDLLPNINKNNNKNQHCTTVGKRPLKMADNQHHSPPMIETQTHQDDTYTSTSSDSKATSLVLTIDDLYTFRKHLQKTEFFMCWIIVLLMSVTNISPSLPVAYLKLSAFTRFLAYVIDFTNAYVKLDGSIPLWLVLHHSGVLVGHITKMFFLTPSSQYQVILFALASQSSHNTWTKKLSLVLYWSNVLVGVVTSYLFHSSHTASNAASGVYWSLVVTTFGISLLVWDTISKVKRV